MRRRHRCSWCVVPLKTQSQPGRSWHGSVRSHSSKQLLTQGGAGSPLCTARATLLRENSRGFLPLRALGPPCPPGVAPGGGGASAPSSRGPSRPGAARRLPSLVERPGRRLGSRRAKGGCQASQGGAAPAWGHTPSRPRQPLGKEATRRPVDGEAAGRAHRPGGERGLLGQGRTASAATGTGVAVSRRPLPPQRSPRRAAGLSGRRAEHSGAGRSGAGRGGRQPHHVHASAKAAHQPLSSRQVLHPQPGDDSTTSQGLIRTKCAHARTHAHAHTHSFKEHAGTGPACSERCLLFAAAGVTR